MIQDLVNRDRRKGRKGNKKIIDKKSEPRSTSVSSPILSFEGSFSQLPLEDLSVSKTKDVPPAIRSTDCGVEAAMSWESHHSQHNQKEIKARR